MARDGTVLREERNRTGTGDQTRHPELELARWAAAHLAPELPVAGPAPGPADELRDLHTRSARGA